MNNLILGKKRINSNERWAKCKKVIIEVTEKAVGKEGPQH